MNLLSSLRLLVLVSVSVLFSLGCSDRVTVLKDLEYGTYPLKDSQGRLLLDLYLPKISSSEPLPVLIFIHGGGWVERSKEDCPGELVARRGFALACINYRYSYQAIFPAQIHAVKAAVRWLRKNATRYNLDPNRFGAWGDSAGGHLSALLGTSAGVPSLEGATGNEQISSKIQAVGDWYGPTDLTKLPRAFAEFPTPEVLAKNQGKPWLRLTEVVYRLLGGPVSQRLELATLANPITHIDDRDPPFLVVHGELDDVVPITQSDLLVKALQEKGVEVEYVRDRKLKHSYRGQNGEPFDPNLMEITLNFFERHLQQ
jgi:acetyl esterase/lipase